MERQRILVCGMRFGKIYLEAILQRKDLYEVVGILGTGGKYSLEISKKYNIPLYTDIDTLPSNIDLACVILRAGALGGEGINITKKLLNAGIPVIHEQPVHHKELIECYTIAQKSNSYLEISNFYKYINSTQKYISLISRYKKTEKIEYINIECGHQVLYSVIGILLEIIENSRPFVIDAIVKDKGPFDILSCNVGGIPCVLKIHNEVDSEDPDNFFYLFYKIQTGFSDGELTLEDPSGPIMWYTRTFVPHDFRYEDFNKSQFADKNIVTICEGINYSDIFQKDWISAVQLQIESTEKILRNKHLFGINMQKQLYQAKQWHMIMKQIGYPREKKRCFIEKNGTNSFQECLYKMYIENCDFDGLLSALSRDVIKEKKEKLDVACLMSMLYTLKGNIDVNKGECLETKLLFENIDVRSDNRCILQRWIKALEEHNFIQNKENCIISNISVCDNDIESAWLEAKKAWSGYLSDHLVIDYYYRNAKHLKKLLRGDINATYLLFPEGKIEEALSFYTNTLIGRYINFIISKKVENCIEPNMTILELGAGTGATTELVLPKVRDNVKYIYTDISTFFLNAASKRFAQYPNVVYQTLDIDQDFEEQNMVCESIDIVIAAGMLNNAKDTIATIRNIRNILKPGGYIIIGEPIADLLELQISQVFMMAKPIDLREKYNQIFFNEKQWRSLLMSQSFKIMHIFPEEAHMLSVLQQKLFIGRKI